MFKEANVVVIPEKRIEDCEGIKKSILMTVTLNIK